MCAFWLRKCNNGDILKEQILPHNSQKLLKEGFYGRITLKCEVLRKGAGKLSVGAPYRILDSSNNEICRAQVRGADDFPVIPGTSVKGVMRSVCEALSPSCVLGSGNECKVNSGKLCIVCSIFGALGYRGRICFSDVVFKARAPEKIKVYIQYPPRKARGDLKFYLETSEKSYIGNNKSISKERMEGIVAPKEGGFYLCVEGLRDWELGLLLLAMGVSKKYSWDLRIGYARNQGLGWVKFSVEKAFLSKGIGADPKDIKEQVDDLVDRYFEEIKRKKPRDISRIQGNINLLKRYWGS